MIYINVIIMNMVLFEYLCIPEHSRIAHVYIVWAHFWVVSSFSCCYILYLLILFFYLYSCCYIDSLLLFNILKPSQPGYNIFCDENWSIWPEVAQLPFAKENMFKWITIPFVINIVGKNSLALLVSNSFIFLIIEIYTLWWANL